MPQPKTFLKDYNSHINSHAEAMGVSNTLAPLERGSLFIHQLNVLLKYYI